MHEIETTGFRESTLVLYDLRDPEQWQQAGRDRTSWGRAYSAMHGLDNDHIIIEFRPGDGLQATA